VERRGRAHRTNKQQSSEPADRFPTIVAAVESLPVRSCFINGEAIVVDHNGLSVFDLLRYWQHDRMAVLCAFDLIELDGEDLRLSPIEYRKRALAALLSRKSDGIALNTHYQCDGPSSTRVAPRGTSFNLWISSTGAAKDVQSQSRCRRGTPSTLESYYK
jgi:hypothetical protein